MTLDTWWLYLGAIVLIACTPGPNVLYVITRSIRMSQRRNSRNMKLRYVSVFLVLFILTERLYSSKIH